MSTPVPPTPSRLFAPYVALVSAAGTVLLAVGLVARGPQAWAGLDARFWVLAALVVAAELRPIDVHRRGGVDSVSLSGAFGCALLLEFDWSLVVAVHAVAALLDERLSGVPWWKSAFNTGQYALAIAPAAGLLHLLSDPSSSGVVAFAAALAACGLFFLLNTVLTGLALAFSEGAPPWPSLRTDLPFQASVNGVVTAMAPVVLAVATSSLWLVLLLLFPVLAVQRGALSALERDHLTRHDSLTGLPNQEAFSERLEEQLREAVATGSHVGVLVLSLDHVSDVSHTLGHAAGDALLRQVTERLEAAVPPGAVVARTGAGSFVIGLPAMTSPWAASSCAEALLQQVGDPYALAESAFALQASAGLTVAPVHGTDPQRLVQLAEIARGNASRAHTGLEVYSPETNDFTERRLAVLRGLRPALLRRELAVHFQPQADVATGRVTGYEALLRWEHPTLGTVPPDEAVALAEYAGMMREVTDHVLDEALRHAAQWRAAGSSATVSVNVSASVLQDPEFPVRVARRLALWGVPSSVLVLELTETAVMSQPERCQAVMRDLRALQVGLALDDYGTGYASLAYLTSLPVDELKIDKTFILGMRESGPHRLVVRSTLDLARALGLRVVAEGVEDAQTAALLRSYGCRTAQGYLYGRAVPAADLVVDLTAPAATVPLPRV